MAITVADQLASFKTPLQAFVQQLDAGNAFVCSDLVHLWAKLWDKSNHTKVLIMYNGEDIRGPFGESSTLGRVDRKFLFVVSRGRGLNVTERGAPLYQASGNENPLFVDVEAIRDIIRGVTFDPLWCENPVDYRGILPFATPPALIVDAYQIECSIGTQLPRAIGTPP